MNLVICNFVAFPDQMNEWLSCWQTLSPWIWINYTFFQQIFVDIIEKIVAKVGPNGNLIRADVSGELILKSYIPHSSVLTLKLNSDLSTIRDNGRC